MVSLAAGELAPARAWLLRRHLRRCDACRREWEETAAVWNGLREMASEPVPGAVSRRVNAALPDLTFPPLLAVPPGMIAGQRVPWAWFGAAGAAAVLVTVLGLAITRREETRAVGPQASRIAGQPARIAPSHLLAQLPAALRPPSQRTAPRPRRLSRRNGLASVVPAADPPVNGGPARVQSRLKAAGASEPVPDSQPASAGFTKRQAPRLRGDNDAATVLPGHGDLAVVNGAPAHNEHRWASLPAAGWDVLEARVRRAVQARDDFVRIPFPRLASTSDRQVAAAVESYKREAVVVDPRLAHGVTLQQKATALSDLCDRLRGDTGVQLAAGQSVADEKVTLFCKKMPLRDVMRQLGRPFGYTWLRSGKAGEYRYELVQDLRSQLLEEELRNRDRNEALLALDAEMQRYRKYLTLSAEEARARAQTASPAEKKLLEALSRDGWGPIQMYFRLSPRDLAALRSGQELTFSAAPEPGEQPLSPDVSRGVLQSWRDRRFIKKEDGSYSGLPDTADPQGLPLIAIPEARGFVTLSLSQIELGEYVFLGGAGFFLPTPQTSEPAGKSMSGLTIDAYAVGRSPAVVKPENRVVNAKLAGEPSLRGRVSIRPQPSCRPAPGLGAAAGGASEPGVTSADVVEALHQATGRPMVADYYTRLYKVEAVAPHNQPLFEALNDLADTMRLRWEKDGEWLRFRSTSYYDDRLKEVPNRLLVRWSAARREHGALRLDDLVEVAQLSDAQLDAMEMAEGARDCWGLAEWMLAWRARRDLRFLAAFTPAQRQTAMSATGLAFTRMSLAQQQQFIPLGLQKEFIPRAPGSQAGQLQSLEELAEAALYVEYTQPDEFQWQVSAAGQQQFDPASVSAGGQAPGTSPAWRAFVGLPVVRERTREAAFQAARRVDPQVSEAQLVPAELALTVVYLRSSPRTGVSARVMRATPSRTSGWGRRLLPDRDGGPDRNHP